MITTSRGRKGFAEAVQFEKRRKTVKIDPDLKAFIDRDGPDFDHAAYAKKLNEEMEARWAKEKEPKREKTFPSHPIPD